jgi:hypothetical protein
MLNSDVVYLAELRGRIGIWIFVWMEFNGETSVGLFDFFGSRVLEQIGKENAYISFFQLAN